MDKKTDVISRWRVVLVLLLFVLTWYLLQVTTMVTSVPIKRSLALFPRQIGDYRMLSSSQSSSEIIAVLGVDDYIQFTYQDPSGSKISLYVAYYESVGVHGGYHSPKNCLPGGGWGIDSINPYNLGMGIEGESKSVVSEMVIRSGDKYQVVLYWYQNRGRIIGSEYWEKIYLVWDAIFKRRRDGSFVRIMANVADGDIAGAEERVKQFGRLVMDKLENYLPGTKYDG